MGQRKRERESEGKKTEREIFPERKGGRKGWLRWEREKRRGDWKLKLMTLRVTMTETGPLFFSLF